MNSTPPVLPDAFTELPARERARAILDEGSFRELIDPFERLESPHLAPQGIVPQADDGAVVARGTIDGERAVVVALDGRFQGGGIGEVCGAKLAGSLELAARDWENGVATRAVILLETGGIRLQEANLGLLAIADIHAAIVRLRRHTPVVGVIAGMVGCYGGMGIAAGLCSHLIMTRQGRLALNGPEVIEQEAGVTELDSKDRAGIWAMAGGAQRVAVHLADTLVDDDTAAVRDAVRAVHTAGPAPTPRSARIEPALALLAAVDTENKPGPQDLRDLVNGAPR
ncbi:biotin-independent malonate decarboxylase subunit beta (plasmid) [Streptomyces sp. BI20]|uniref:biotin-independent malonate decarboxylase subunit beta n=1 Tax=Streptomyces sp. BI20 TaxID=3403460 RepID=UPI003C73A4E4